VKQHKCIISPTSRRSVNVSSGDYRLVLFLFITRADDTLLH